ncbi:hypothetical protein J5N97_000619 [Dioscorea zingiberensis]|uniref:Uncharacterized protein n=1 Tax=Dioscorea zingiberensis TaxID=325984 RepID=A0A9D5H197_9LILI|nr:hypothetical protein J5N97_000619 [Dioscorea zingiberensis]
MWRGSGEPADSFYAVRPECSDVTKTRFKIKAGRTLSVMEVAMLHLVLMVAWILARLWAEFNGGVHPSIRGEVWEFYLDVLIPEAVLMSENNRDNKGGLDVLRTDRTLVF